MKSFFTAFAGLMAFGLLAQDDLINKVKDQGSEGAERGFQFETLIDLEATPVKNQGRSGTCWSYATAGFLESELIRMGKKPIDLSEMYTVRHVYADKAEKYVRLHGHLNFAQGGALPDMLYVIEHYGAVPQEVYQGLNYGSKVNNHSELEALLKAQLDQIIKNKNGHIAPNWKEAFTATLDAYLGPLPQDFEWEGKRYTPRSFADDYLVINPNDYLQLTSFTHHPFYREVMLQVPDNWAWGKSFNLPLDEMMAGIDLALEQGYTVAWAADVSEKGFSLKNGLAVVPATDYEEMNKAERAEMFDGPKPEKEITQALRQAAYDSYQTTDDHAMQITGKVKDQNGTSFYIVKNSWGDRENELRTGYLYVSEAFVRYKTISVLLHREALSKRLLKKMKS